MTLAQYKEGREISETALKLIDKLTEYSEGDDEFIIGVLVDLKTDDERRLVIQYIDEGGDVSYENIILFSLNEVTLSSFGENVSLNRFKKTGSANADEANIFSGTATESLTQVTYKNNATTEIPETLYNCKNLTQLTVSSCDVSTIGEGIGNLDNVTTLSLGSSCMKTIPAGVFGMSGLTSITSNYSDFESIDGDWGSLTNLTSNSFYSCNITEIPYSLANATSLKTITLGQNPLSSIPANVFDNMENLSSVSIGSYFRGTFDGSSWTYTLDDEDANEAWNKLQERGVSANFWGFTTLSQLTKIETSSEDTTLKFKAYDSDKSATIYVPSGTSTYDLTPYAAKSDTIIQVNGTDVASYGTYTVQAQMIKTDRENKSMADNAVDHTVTITVKDGEYYATLDFNGMTISLNGKDYFGYLSKLYYYNAGYTYEYGYPQGTTTAAEVLSTQKNSDGTDVIDEYNDADNLYPDLVKIKLVDKASEEYVPLQVFVPIMESISEGNGTQDVLMKIDWTSLETVSLDPTEPTEPATPDEPETVLWGDANCDGTVDINDVTAIQKYLAELGELSEDGLKAANVDGSDRLSISDVTTIQKYIAQIITKFPVEE